MATTQPKEERERAERMLTAVSEVLAKYHSGKSAREIWNISSATAAALGQSG